MVLLRGVLATVFFAVTVAYVLYPLRQWLSRRGLGPRVAAGTCTTIAFLAGVAVVTPVVVVLYLRRGDLFAYLRQLPATIPIEVGGFSFVIDVQSTLSSARSELTDLAIEIGAATPVLALKAFLFALLVYGLLLRPVQLRNALLRPVPPGYEDVVLAFHRRTRSTLYALYVLQAATALGTFLVGYVVFWALGYDAAFVLAVLSGVLQFIPVIGPSVLVLGVAAVEVVAENVVDAALVAVLGLVFVGFLPDAVIRPRLARLTTGLPASLYFAGFVGGVLSVGVVGVIAGPLVVAFLAEAVDLLSAENHSIQRQLE